MKNTLIPAEKLQEKLQKREKAIEAREDRKINAASRRAAARIIRGMKKTGHTTIGKEKFERILGKRGQLARTIQLLEEAGYICKKVLKEGFGVNKGDFYYVIVTPDNEDLMAYYD